MTQQDVVTDSIEDAFKRHLFMRAYLLQRMLQDGAIRRSLKPWGESLELRLPWRYSFRQDVLMFRFHVLGVEWRHVVAAERAVLGLLGPINRGVEAVVPAFGEARQLARDIERAKRSGQDEAMTHARRRLSELRVGDGTRVGAPSNRAWFSVPLTSAVNVPLWPAIGDLAARVYDLILPGVERSNTWELGKGLPAYSTRALRLVAAYLNWRFDLGLYYEPISVSGVKSRIQSRRAL